MMENVFVDGFYNSIDSVTANALGKLCEFYDELKKGDVTLNMSMVMNIVRENVEYVKAYKNVSTLLNMLLILPATICTAERSFSLL